LRRHASGFYGKDILLGEELTVRDGQYTWMSITSKISDRIKTYGPAFSNSPYGQRLKCKELRAKYQAIIVNAKGNLSSVSLDLVKGMYRQLDFINKICVNFDYWNDEAVISASITRYFKFMDLMKRFGRKKMLVPTMDIDLVWHTHQINHGDYYKCTTTYFHDLIDHDDTIPGEDLLKGYARTFIYWSRAYNEAYSSHPPDYAAWRRNHKSIYSPFGLYREIQWIRHSSTNRPVRQTPTAVAVPVREESANAKPLCVLATPVYDSSYRPDNNLTLLESI